MKSRSWVAVAALLALVMAAGDAAGQSFQGSVRGVVRDAQGVIPGVTVTLLNEENGTTRETVTNATGEYSFPSLTPGTFTAKAVVAGFKAFERKGVRVGTNESITVNVLLEVGGIEETITVSGDAPLMDTANASTGDVIDSKALESIPTAGRSIFLLANLEPTVQASGNAHWNRMQDQVGNSAVSVGGGAVRANNYLIDGFPITDLQNRASTNPSMEAVDDMKVQVHTYDAEMGRTGGGVFNLTAKSGANLFSASAYTTLRPESMEVQLLVPQLQGKPFVPEYWRDGGGGGGGPIVKNKTFFWMAGEKYVDNQPQASSMLLTTEAERNGDFSGLTRVVKGVTTPVIIKDPLTGVPFLGNIIPANRIDPVAQKIMKYLPTADRQVDDGNNNFTMTDLLPNKAWQLTGKVDHHFNNNVAVSGFALRQVTHEANVNYNPVNRFVGGSYQLDRVIKTYVFNNTYIVNSSTVFTVRAGYNHFDDNYNIPEAFDSATLGWPGALTSAFSDTNRFPTTAPSGYKSTGWSSRSADGYYQYGINGTLSRLAGSHSLKAGGDYRVLGDKSASYGASTGSYTFGGSYSTVTTNGVPTNSGAAADMLLGYFSSATVPLNKTLDGSVRYYAGYAQDDWRVNDKFTINYGVRLEHETGLSEKDNQITVNFDQTAVSPLNSQVNLIDPLTGAKRQILGGLVYAGQNGAPTEQGNMPKVTVAPRVGAVYSLDNKTIVRGGWGLFYAPYNYPSGGTTGWAQYGYSATTQTQNPSTNPTYRMSNPFPNGLTQPSGNSLGLLTGAGTSISFIDPNKGQPRIQQYSIDFQRELPGSMSVTLGYTGLRGDNMSWGTSININQLDPKYQSLFTQTSATTPATTASVPNPFYGIAAAGGFANNATIPKGQLLRPFPQFDTVNMSQVLGAHSLYHALIVQLRKRSTGWWGGQISYTLSRLNDNQVGASNYYSSSPGLQNSYEILPGSPYYDPEANYGRSLLDSPHKVVIAPTVNVPVGEGRRFLNKGGVTDALLGGWSITPVITIQSGFPMGVSQQVSGTYNFLMGGTPRPNIVPGVAFVNSGEITGRIKASTCPTGCTADNLWYNNAAFSLSPLNTFGNAPRMLPGVTSPVRNNVDVSVRKEVHAGRATVSVSVESINVFNFVQWAAPSGTFNSTAFGQVDTQANNMRMVQFTLRAAF